MRTKPFLFYLLVLLAVCWLVNSSERGGKHAIFISSIYMAGVVKFLFNRRRLSFSSNNNNDDNHSTKKTHIFMVKCNFQLLNHHDHTYVQQTDK